MLTCWSFGTLDVSFHSAIKKSVLFCSISIHSLSISFVLWLIQAFSDTAYNDLIIKFYDAYILNTVYAPYKFKLKV